jgi:hypothetical protein
MQNCKYRTKLVAFLSQYNFTEFLTLTENYDKGLSLYAKGGQSTVRKDSFWSKVKTFFRHLSIRVYGTGRNRHKRIQHATFFEDKDIYGGPTHIHCHSLVIIEPEFRERFMKYARTEWMKLNRITHMIRRTTPLNGDYLFSGFDIQYIYEIYGVCNYVTKYYEHSDFVPIIELQDRKRLIANSA